MGFTLTHFIKDKNTTQLLRCIKNILGIKSCLRWKDLENSFFFLHSGSIFCWDSNTEKSLVNLQWVFIKKSSRLKGLLEIWQIKNLTCIARHYAHFGWWYCSSNYVEFGPRVSRQKLHKVHWWNCTWIQTLEIFWLLPAGWLLCAQTWRLLS